MKKVRDFRRKNLQAYLKKHRPFDPVVFSSSEANARSALKTRKQTSTGLSPYTGEWSETQVAHLLKRAQFGVTTAEIQSFTTKSLDDCIDILLQTPTPPPAPVNDYFDFAENDNPDEPEDVSPGEEWVYAPRKFSVSFYRHMSLKTWWIRNILEESESLHQKLLLFWHALLPVQFFETDLPKLSYQYYQLLHSHAFGNFKTLIRELTTNPSMLVYLNGYLNVKDAPDENYARELQELFTVGKGPNSNYTESDVYEAARLLTGWTIVEDSVFGEGSPQSIFYPENHDTGNKSFSAFYNHSTITGLSGADGANETDELIDMIFATDEVALYICRRLYNFFVYHHIDANAEENVIQPLAQIFRDSQYDIKPVLSALFKSEHFFDPVNRGAYIKSPADHFLGMARVLGTNIPSDPSEKFEYTSTFYWLMADLGMELGDPPSVSGWQAYYQQPSYDKTWINTDTITKRAQYQDFMIYQLTDLPAFAQSLNNPGDPNDLIQECSLLFLGIPLDPEVSAGLKAILLGGQQGDFYWSGAWDDYTDAPTNDTYRAIVDNRLKSMFRSMLQLSEFQLF